jgi:glycosyltransferase involved in cell wall biosynthesis
MDYYRNKGMKHVDVALTQNDYQDQKLQENFNRKSYRMISGHPLPNHKLSISERFQNKIILWCANLGTRKRPELFIELGTELKDENFKLIMVGGHSDKEYVNKLLSNKPENVEVTGTLSFEEALAYFDRASIFVNTSAPGGDGFPNTFIQAWLREVPVVSFGFDPDHVISENKLGYVATDVNDAKDYIQKILSSNADYNLLSNNVYDYALKNHTIKIMTDNFINTINKSEE